MEEPKRKRYRALIFGDGGSMNAVLFPNRCAVVVESRLSSIVGPKWSIVGTLGGLTVAGKGAAVTAT